VDRTADPVLESWGGELTGYWRTKVGDMDWKKWCRRATTGEQPEWRALSGGDDAESAQGAAVHRFVPAQERTTVRVKIRTRAILDVGDAMAGWRSVLSGVAYARKRLRCTDVGCGDGDSSRRLTRRAGGMHGGWRNRTGSGFADPVAGLRIRVKQVASCSFCERSTTLRTGWTRKFFGMLGEASCGGAEFGESMMVAMTAEGLWNCCITRRFRVGRQVFGGSECRMRWRRRDRPGIAATERNLRASGREGGANGSANPTVRG